MKHFLSRTPANGDCLIVGLHNAVQVTATANALRSFTAASGTEQNADAGGALEADAASALVTDPYSVMVTAASAHGRESSERD